MKTLVISIERKGILIPVGTIEGSSASDARFRYYPEYLHDPSAAAVSISLPLQKEPFSPGQTEVFFEGLLPEGFTRRSVAQWMRVDEGDYLSILHRLGRECIGAVCVTEENEPVKASYEPVSMEQISELAAEGASKSAEIVTRTHLSLAGATGKVGLYHDPEQDRWFLPEGTAPSTHIVKQSHVRLDSIVTNEQLALMTAAGCGISTPCSFIINTGKGDEHEVLLATERFDRVISPGSDTINGIRRPFRLHQEDFAQAMGIPASLKYENGNAGYMREMFEILRKYSADPIADRMRLWDMIVFDYLAGNTDAHIKNFSLLYSQDLRSIRLAPAYDIVCTAVYEQSTRDMAFSIGGDSSLDVINEDSFRRAAKEAGLGEKMAMRRFEHIRNLFIPAIERAAAELLNAGFYRADELKERVLRNGGIRTFMN